MPTKFGKHYPHRCRKRRKTSQMARNDANVASYTVDMHVICTYYVPVVYLSSGYRSHTIRPANPTMRYNTLRCNYNVFVKLIA